MSIPDTMRAWVVREERHGKPIDAMQLETVPVPKPGPSEVLIKVKSAGVNFNHIWACLGRPVTVSQLHPDDPVHIGGSDASGIIVAMGTDVVNLKIGDEVITQPAQNCGQCGACNGFHTGGCEYGKAWGYETSHGSFAEYALVQARQVLPKPPEQPWDAASCYGLKLFTTYRMLVVNGEIKPNDRVLIWGASGGLGSYAIQMCLALNAIPICVVSSKDKEAYCRQFGAELFIDRSDYPYLSDKDASGSVPTKDMRRFKANIRDLTGGFDPDIVFEHVGATTFPTSVFVARKFGKIVICGATTGYQLTFDVRYLWMHQKQILGSHGCSLHDAKRANIFIERGLIKPTLSKTYDFEDAALAHQDLMNGKTLLGSVAINVDPS